MRLTREEHPRAVERYRHVTKARVWHGAACGAQLVGTRRSCSRPRGHSGPHVGHGFFRTILAVWDSDSAGKALEQKARLRRTTSAPAARPPRGTPLGLGDRTPEGIVRTLWRRVETVVSSGEELAFLVFLLAFVGFALYWLTLLMG